MSSVSHELRALIDRALLSRLPQSSLAGGAALNEAIRRAVFPGGKRMRPIFTLLAARAAGVPAEAALDAACAVELLHSSSLVFDDLPCMDDAGLRRDLPPVHLLCGESVALLAALALMNEAYALLGANPTLLREAARCVGVNGMIGGQAADLCGVGFEASDGKTTALMRLTLVAGAMAGDAPAGAVGVLTVCGERLGHAYQALDDLTDAAEDERGVRAVSPGQIAREIDDCCNLLRNALGAPAAALVSAIEAVFAEVGEPAQAAA